jgi:hypothetical protein
MAPRKKKTAKKKKVIVPGGALGQRLSVLDGSLANQQEVVKEALGSLEQHLADVRAWREKFYHNPLYRQGKDAMYAKQYAKALEFMERLADEGGFDMALLFCDIGTVKCFMREPAMWGAPLDFERVYEHPELLPGVVSVADNNFAWLYTRIGDVDEARKLCPGTEPKKIRLKVFDVNGVYGERTPLS